MASPQPEEQATLPAPERRLSSRKRQPPENYSKEHGPGRRVKKTCTLAGEESKDPAVVSSNKKEEKEQEAIAEEPPKTMKKRGKKRPPP